MVKFNAFDIKAGVLTINYRYRKVKSAPAWNTQKERFENENMDDSLLGMRAHEGAVLDLADVDQGKYAQQ
jgi:hypothetical protein